MGLSPIPELLLFAGLLVFVWWLWREEAHQELDRSALLDPERDTPRERVLFICIHNSVRSQMAEALLRRAAPGRFYVASAGTAPTHLHPLTERVMGEIGVSLHTYQAKALSEVGPHWDYVITVCDAALEVCPDFPAKTSCLHWSVADPSTAIGTSTERTAAFQRARDDLQRRIDAWLADKRER